MDLAANFCYGTVTTAPAPAASGTSMVVTLLGGCTLPAAPWNAFVWLTGVGPLASNAEIIRVTAFSQVGATATLSTIVRTQEGSSARTIVVGDQFAVGPTAKFITDLIAELAAKSATLNDTGAGQSLIVNATTAQLFKLIAGGNITLTPGANGITIAAAGAGSGDVVGPAGATGGNFALFDGATGKLIEDAGISPGDIAAAISAAQAAAEAASQPIDADLTAIAALTPSNDDIIQRKAGAWTNRTVAQYKDDLALTNVTNNAQTQAAIVPNTAPSAGQILAGNAGGTAYAPVSVSGDGTLASTGALTIAADAITNAKLAEMLANTVKVNATGSTANPTDLAMAASTILARLASGDIIAATVAQLNALLQLDGLTTGAAGFRGIPQTSVSAARTVAAADNGTHWYHPSADTSARTWTIDSNANLALPLGFTLTFINDASAGVITIAITSDTLVLAGAGTTGSRSLAANGIATIVKMTSTRWQINGTGLT